MFSGNEGKESRGAYLFWHKCDPDRPLTTVQKAHEKAISGGGFRPPFRLYDLRHTYASRATMAGVDLATLKELLGHSHISVTIKYVHPTPEHKREALNKLERFNAAQLFAACEKRSGSPQKSPQ